MVKLDGSSLTLVKTGKPFYDAQPGGLFWCVKHEGGLYQLQASQLLEYIEMTPKPVRGQKAEILRKGMY